VNGLGDIRPITAIYPSGRKGSAFQAEDVVDVQQFRKAGAEVAGRYLDAQLCELSPFPITFANLKTS
jgi:hypothetical protein